MLGPLDQDEERVLKETVRRNVSTSRFSRYFRNFWHHYPERFEDFRGLVESTWPGMSVAPPEYSLETNVLAMYFLEQRITRELNWAGTGFQVWCQMLTQIVRVGQSGLLVLDEPEAYLHSGLQRQLVDIFREQGADVILATHSPDLIGYAEPGDILVVDKAKASARRIASPQVTRRALRAIGSLHNATLTQVARTKRVLFVEGDDFRVLSRFARCVGLDRLASGIDFGVIDTHGLPSVEGLAALIRGIETALGHGISSSAIFDSDARGASSVQELIDGFSKHVQFLHIWHRHEIENYLLVPRAIERAVAAEIGRRGRPIPILDGDTLLGEVLVGLRADAEGVFVAQRVENARKSEAAASVVRRATWEFEQEWKSTERRVELAPGKEALAALNRRLSGDFGVSITSSLLVASMLPGDVPTEMGAVLRRLDKRRLAGASSDP
jgi:hypothetical protein